MYRMKVHFIAIGGAVMHNLAIALHKKGYIITGSDDEIFEPSRSRLAHYGLLPGKYGWDPGRITTGIDTIILGMHAKSDNPELIKAHELGIKIMSFPEYLYEQTKDKKRIVVAGSHGKTTTTAMIMHVFKFLGIKFDYMVGSLIDGFETMVGLSDDAQIAVFEGDEYLTSALDKRPKFHLYMPDIAILNGIAWDHMNVFPTFENYIGQFKIFVEKISDGGSLIYFDGDAEVKKYPEREIIACLELHTYSSLNNDFLPLYNGTLANATVAFVYFNLHAIELKKLKPLSKKIVIKAFAGENISVYDNSEELFSFIKTQNYSCPVYLFMSSGDFDGFDLTRLVE